MFVHPSSAEAREYSTVLAAFFPPRRRKDTDGAKALHVRSLCDALETVRNALSYVWLQLAPAGDSHWSLVQDRVAQDLAVSTAFLSGVLDGCVLASMQSTDAGAGASHLFSSTPFRHEELRAIQAEIGRLRSKPCGCSDAAGTDFFMLADFWRRHPPYKPVPSSVYVMKGIIGDAVFCRDLKVALAPGAPGGDDESATSGPIMRQLLIPTFNCACRIADVLLEMYEVDRSRVRPIQMHE
jgi:hypothetical protein